MKEELLRKIKAGDESNEVFEKLGAIFTEGEGWNCNEDNYETRFDAWLEREIDALEENEKVEWENSGTTGNEDR